MNGTVREWLAKADGDYRTARREFDVADGANHDAVCFHAQQCIEKTIKAMLIQRKIAPPRTHDLVEIAKLLHDCCPSWQGSKEGLRLLTQAGIAFRYPGDFAIREHAAKALAACTELRDELSKLIESG